MTKSNRPIFILWGESFEEATATIFVTELRRAGLPVKTVGLNQRTASGLNGMALMPDTSLEQVISLAKEVRCLILPCTATGGQYLKCDPRLPPFFQQAAENQALFVVGDLPKQELAATGLGHINEDQLSAYPTQPEALFEFIRTLAKQLSNF